MNGVPRALVFSVAYAATYMAMYYLNLSPVKYYPETGELRFFAAPDEPGQIIVWYGWVLTATLSGALLAFIVPPKISARIPPDILWVVGIVVVVAVLMYERRWFFT